MSIAFPNGVDVDLTTGTLGNFTYLVDGEVASVAGSTVTIATFTPAANSSGVFRAHFTAIEDASTKVQTYFVCGSYYNSSSMSTHRTIVSYSEQTSTYNVDISNDATDVLFRGYAPPGTTGKFKVTAFIVEASG